MQKIFQLIDIFKRNSVALIKYGFRFYAGFYLLYNVFANIVKK
ncbi:hypothetical protein [Fibrobacter succinogenes]|nr:hypothetical protein [Fibrobacter succinogenes]